MDNEVSEVVVGLMVAVFGLIGLFLCAGATDDEMYVFGLSLAGFSFVFIFGLIRAHYDRAEVRVRKDGRNG